MNFSDQMKVNDGYQPVFTPKALYSKAQGQRRSRATLG
jgi:hypothetical protein